jgi:hypothetical protein
MPVDMCWKNAQVSPIATSLAEQAGHGRERAAVLRPEHVAGEGLIGLRTARSRRQPPHEQHRADRGHPDARRPVQDRDQHVRAPFPDGEMGGEGPPRIARHVRLPFAGGPLAEQGVHARRRPRATPLAWLRPRLPLALKDRRRGRSATRATRHSEEGLDAARQLYLEGRLGRAAARRGQRGAAGARLRPRRQASRSACRTSGQRDSEAILSFTGSFWREAVHSLTLMTLRASTPTTQSRRAPDVGSRGA